MTPVDEDPSAHLVERVAERAEVVRERIRAAGGDPEVTRLLAVTKGHPAEAVAAALACGLVDVGESYAQELSTKADAFADALADAEGDVPRWHMIGRLQSNKVRTIAPHVHLWQSVDRLSLAAEVARRAPGAAVLVQVNVAGADQQGGCRPEHVDSVVDGCRDLGLEVRGLMAIGVRGDDDEVRGGFRRLRSLVDRLALSECSMGMSADLEHAVAEGSTMVRIGTALFGPRSRPGAVGN